MTPSPRRRLTPLVFVTSALLVLASTDLVRLAAQQPPGQERVNVIIGFNQNPGAAERALVTGLGGQVRHTYHLIPAIAANLPQAAVTALANNPRISVIEPDGVVQANDLELDNSWGVKRIGGGGTVVNGTTYAGAGATVFILDSGLAWDHPDLQGQLVWESSWDFVSDDFDPYDDDSHGTHVAGTVAALDNNTGVVGVAPLARVASLKVLDAQGSGSWSDIIAALQFAVDHGAKVTNNSYGSSGYPGTLVEQAYAAADAAGVVIVASAGNSGNCAGKNDSVGYPGKFSSVIAVAATDSTNARACFSSTGPSVAFAAPGVSIVSTIPGNQYAAYSGTSMASPHVAGLVALLLGAGLQDANNNGRLSDEVRAILSSSARDLGASGRDNQYGFGLVDAPAALAALLGGTPPSGTTAASVAGITYTRTGPGGRNLNIAVRVVDQSQAPIAGATVSVVVKRDGLSYASGSGATNSSGVATFQIKNAPGGCYSTDVTGISASGLTFDGTEPYTNFCG